MHRIAAVVAGLSLAFVGTSATFADTINVPGDYPTIQGAINASVNGDVINIAAGTYNETNLNPGGRAITIQGTFNGDGSLATTIDAQQGGSVFVIVAGEGEGTVIKDLVIANGSATYGGGIYCDGGSNPTITGCTIEGNTAVAGGGIYCVYSTPTITNCTITGNTANQGGGIYGRTNTITNCTITGNTAYWYGGGIFCEGDSNPTITGCTIEGNTADYGGGIYGYDSNLTISDSLICGNEGYYSPNQIDGPYTASGSCIEESCDLCTADSDADGVPDWQDQCPGQDDTIDTDSDGTPDCADGCPDDPLKTEPGDCGCGALETDTDSDGTPDCIDGCPEDPLKTEPGVCGCGTAETNVNGDVDCDGDYDIDDIYAGMDSFGIDNGPTGACCVASGCVANSNDDCTALGGTWLGEDASCDDCAPTCQGDANADGVVDVFDLLKVIDGWGTCP